MNPRLVVVLLAGLYLLLGSCKTRDKSPADAQEPPPLGDPRPSIPITNCIANWNRDVKNVYIAWIPANHLQNKIQGVSIAEKTSQLLIFFGPRASA